MSLPLAEASAMNMLRIGRLAPVASNAPESLSATEAPPPAKNATPFDAEMPPMAVPVDSSSPSPH